MSLRRRIWLRVHCEAEECERAMSSLVDSGFEVSPIVAGGVLVPSFDVPGPNGPEIVCGAADILEWARENSG